MPFFTEPDHYEKTILSDLQGAWEVLRAAVVDHAGFPNWERFWPPTGPRRPVS